MRKEESNGKEGEQTETRVRKQLKTEDFSMFSVDYNSISPSPFWDDADHAAELRLNSPKFLENVANK